MEELLEILTDLHPDVDFSTCTNLVDGGILDSFDIVSLITEITDNFDISISADDIVPANFNSAQAIFAMIQKKMDDEG